MRVLEDLLYVYNCVIRVCAIQSLVSFRPGFHLRAIRIFDSHVPTVINRAEVTTDLPFASSLAASTCLTSSDDLMPLISLY